MFDLDASDLCDLTPLVADALMSELPTVCLCGGRSCRQHEGRQPVWTSSTPEAAGSPGAAAATSPFAQQLLKARGGKGGNKKRK